VWKLGLVPVPNRLPPLGDLRQNSAVQPIRWISAFIAACVAAIATDAAAFESNAPAPRFKIPRSMVEGFPPPRLDPAKVAVGERLFLETRFSQFFYSRAKGDVNATLAEGDPVVSQTRTAGTPLPGPFAGFAINCRACHLVNEHFARGHGNRTYADYARRSPVPERDDGRTLTPRNSPALVNASIPREGHLFLHFDGEFASGADLVKGTLTGRNFGWLPDEHDAALANVVRVIREDVGRGPLAREFGGWTYREMFLGTNAALGEESKRFRLPEELRLDIMRASDAEAFDAVARLVAAYMDSLQFSRDESWEYDGSPYDAFLETNRFPRRVDSGATERYYNRHLADLIQSARELVFVDGTNGVAPPAPGRFKTLKRAFRFGPKELAGARIFFATADNSGTPRAPGAGVGNCALCHPAPNFTDFKFHNTGVAQEEYDSLHGAGQFAKLKVPGLAKRNADLEAWLPPTPRHPQARGPFLDIPAKSKPGRADLGLWNVFANPDLPAPQAALRAVLNGEEGRAPDGELLPRTLALFKTPGLRGLAFSGPYMHNGSKDTLEEVVRYYIKTSALVRAGKVRNAATELSGIALREEDIAPLVAFLESLNEDYE